MLPRFYAPGLNADLAMVTLPAEEARHLTRVLRLAAGDEVAIFNGRGLEYRAVIEVAVRDTVSLRLVEPLPSPATPAVQLVVAQAVLKGSSMDEAVRDAAMMGAEAIEPLMTAFTDVKASFAKRPEMLERWRRVALSAVKQSRRATLPLIREPRNFGDWISEPSGEMRLIFVEPSARCATRHIKTLLENNVPTRAAVLLGPEGGWAEAEVEAALAHGCIPLTLGPLTLRAESMPVAAMAALGVIWEG